MAAAVLSCFMYAYPRVEWATPAESLRERSASGASALAASIAFCEYVTALGRLPGFGSSTYAPAKSNNVGKLFGFAARLFSPYETNRFISLRSDSDIIAYDAIDSSNRELGNAGVNRSMYAIRFLASLSSMMTLNAADSRNSYDPFAPFFSSAWWFAKS